MIIVNFPFRAERASTNAASVSVSSALVASSKIRMEGSV